MHIIKNLLGPMILAMGLWGCSENSDAFLHPIRIKKDILLLIFIMNSCLALLVPITLKRT
jgi:hypothetical protein